MEWIFQANLLKEGNTNLILEWFLKALKTAIRFYDHEGGELDGIGFLADGLKSERERLENLRRKHTKMF